MSIIEKKITLAELLDAIEKNGYEQAFGKWMVDKDGNEVEAWSRKTAPDPSEFVAACAISQGALNLGIKSFTGFSAGVEIYTKIVHAITRKNDVDKKTPEQIAKEIREEYTNFLNEKLTGIPWESDMPHGYSIGR